VTRHVLPPALEAGPAQPHQLSFSSSLNNHLYAASAPVARGCWCCVASHRRCCHVCSRQGAWHTRLVSFAGPASAPAACWCRCCSTAAVALQDWGATHLCFESDTEPYAKTRLAAAGLGLS
jgi:hypothetical protein